MTLTEAIEIVESVWADPEDPITDAKEKEALRAVLQAAKQHQNQPRITELQINTLAMYFAKELGASYQHEFWKDVFERVKARTGSMPEAWVEANKALIKHTLSHETK